LGEKTQKDFISIFSIIYVKKSHCKTTNSSIPASLKDVFKKISLFNYKNFSEANFEFDGKIICFVGIGKNECT
jgi:hypothetical protein